jgi:2-dehydro-3-deoxyphosphogluconate aldolase / (4S)-4-hydroxy-2-oxoglutarate aldolase
MSRDVLGEIRRLRIVPLIVLDDPARAEMLAAALIEGGLPIAEVSLQTPRALDALRRMAAARPDMLVGAGTVLTPEQAAQAREAGARFIVSPGFDARVVDYCQANNLPVIPGVCTPTEIQMALAKGLTVLKFFPAESIGGIATLQAIAAPFPDVEFIPTGGINPGNLVKYLVFKRAVACGGSWMAPPDWIASGFAARISAAAKNAAGLVQQATGS